MNVVTRGIRNAFRNTVRTVSIVVILGLSVGLALAMLVARQAVGQKIQSVQASVGNTVSISPAGLRGLQGGGDALTETQLAAIKKMAHVSSLNESLEDQLNTQNTNLQSAIDLGSLGKRFAENGARGFSQHIDQNDSANGEISGPPVTLRGTTAPAELSSTIGDGTFTLKSGSAFGSTSTDSVAMVGSTLATKNNLKVGSTFTAYGTTVTVTGIFDAGNTFSNNQVIMPLATVQKLTNQSGSVTSATAKVDSVTNVAAVTTAIKNALGDKADVTNEAEQAKNTIAPLQNIQTISTYSLIGAVGAGAVIVLLTMVMIVRERRREIGVIKAIGASNFKVMFQFMAEAVTLTTFGAVIGIGLGVVAANPITKMLVNNTATSSGPSVNGGPGGGLHIEHAGPLGGLHSGLANIHAAVGWSIILYGFAAALVIAIVGSAMASFFIAKVRPAEVMRTE
ncbi:MAG TPA: FtsX-like permease family protein [Candidatus Saccharimonadales bacterium]|nr:FtsX-like permease family protein [Candidatus Saccharimonadales bacterium]